MTDEFVGRTRRELREVRQNESAHSDEGATWLDRALDDLNSREVEGVPATGDTWGDAELTFTRPEEDAIDWGDTTQNDGVAESVADGWDYDDLAPPTGVVHVVADPTVHAPVEDMDGSEAVLARIEERQRPQTKEDRAAAKAAAIAVRQAQKEEKAAAKLASRAALEEEVEEEREKRLRVKREAKAEKERAKLDRRRNTIRERGGKVGFWQGTSKPKPIDITNAVRALATLLDTSPGELQPVEMMAEEFAGTQIGDAFDRIYTRMVMESMPLVEAFAPETLFPPVVHNMLAVGARTVAPGASLRSAVRLMEKGDDAKRKLKMQSAEPIAVGTLSLASLFGTAYFVMPVFVTLYEALKMPIPPVSAAVLALSNIMVWVLGISLVVTIGVLVWWFLHGRTSLRVRVAIDRWKLRAPLMGKANQTDMMFQVLNIMYAYLSVGAAESKALTDTAAAIENRAVKRHLRGMSNALLDGSKTFAEFLDDPMFPRLARNIMAAGQRAGRTMETLESLRDIYEREAAIESEQGISKVVNTVTGVSSLIFVVVVCMVTVPPLEMFGSTLSYGTS